MLARITQVSHLGGYRLQLTFTDGLTAPVDLRDAVVGRGGMLAPLEDEHFFSQARVDAEVGTVVWPNGIDFDPDVLRSLAAATPHSSSLAAAG
jgi:hypothetical protein